ncbi:MAG: YfiR family protein [Bacteroidia bacterium]|nr:YfiR family protein [Bacteroidia bacterium]
MPVQQPLVDTQAKIQAMYIKNLATQCFDWPSDYKTGNFVIALAGKPRTALMEHLERLVENRSVGSQKIELKIINTPEEIGKFPVVFYPKESLIPAAKLITKCKGQSTLLITEKEGYAQQGAGISFIYKDSRLYYEFNKSAVQKQKISIGSEIEKSSSTIIVNQ